MRKLCFMALLFLSFSAFAKRSPLNCSAQFSFQVSGTTLSVYPFSGMDSIYTHYWNFGDLYTSTDIQANHTYNQCGTYTVYHEIVQYGANGEIVCADSSVMIINIVCNNNCIAHAGFSVQGNNANPSNFVFINSSTISTSGAAVSCHWDFGDGATQSTGSIMNVEHHYLASGNYNTCLFVVAEVPGTNIVCRDTFCTSIQVQVPDSVSCNLTASFNAHATQNNSHLFEFVNTSTTSAGGIDSVFWNFGDGAYATTTNAAHNFSTPGVYQVCLTVMNNLNTGAPPCVSNYCMNVVIAPDSNACNLVPNFEYSLNPNMNVHFGFGGANNFPDSTAIITWSFGDNTTATGYSVNHEYAHTGTYLVCVTETLSNGCTKDTCKEIHVESATPNPCNLIPYVSYHNNNVNPNEYEFIGMPNSLDSGMIIYWYFSDSSFATGNSVAHVFDQPGVYSACMHVVYNGNCTADTCISITAVPTGSNTGTVIAFPNPAQNSVSVNLELTQSEAINAAIYNLQNVLVAQSTYSGVPGMNTLTFDISNLAVGVYTIRLYHNGIVTVARFQKL